MRIALLPALITIATACAAQTHVAVPYACTIEDIEHFGLNCTAELPCPVYADLNSVASIGARVFVTGNLHTETVTLYSLLFGSEDNGVTWKETYDRVKSGNLDQIQFTDFQNGFISGGLLMTLPRDPFFLITRDGGQTWHDRPVFDEGRIGTISEFWFDNKSEGQLVLDHTRTPESGNRYELHETMTGGDTWLPKQLSPKPIRMTHSRPSIDRSGWRLTPDPKTKTIHVEVERASKWESVAIFPIHVGDCRPPEPKTPEEPPK